MAKNNNLQMMKRINGFTLVELMVTVAIVGILGAVVYPSYLGQLQKSRRSDAKVLLSELMNRQDVFKSNYGVYTTVIVAPSGCADAACGLNLGSANGKEGYYAATAAAGPTGNINSSVTITAAIVSGGKQAGDACGSFTFTSTGVKGVSGTGDCW